MRVTKQVRDYISLATNELDQMGIEWTVEIDSRHSRLIYVVGGRTLVTGISNSPSDKRAALNLRTQVKIAVRQEMERQQCR
jgi:hypothetical protein